NTEPAVGWSRPASSIISVVLPDPDGPTMANISPASTIRSALRSATTAPCSLAYTCTSPAHTTSAAADVGVSVDVIGRGSQERGRHTLQDAARRQRGGDRDHQHRAQRDGQDQRKGQRIGQRRVGGRGEL